jgi:hypothetical protein
MLITAQAAEWLQAVQQRGAILWLVDLQRFPLRRSRMWGAACSPMTRRSPCWPSTEGNR